MSQLAPELATPQGRTTSVRALIARPQPLVDLWCGVLLPLLCFALDPGVVNGSIPTFLVARFPLAVFALCAVSMGALLLWHLGGRDVPGVGAALAGILSAGGVLALLVGINLLPFSLLGLLIGIGVLGFVPFLTAFVYLRAAAHSVGEGEGARTRPWEGRLAIASAVLATGLAAGYQVGADRVIEQSVAEIAGPDPVAAGVAVGRMRQWRVLLPTAEMVRLARSAAWSDRDDTRAAKYRAAYLVVTGEVLSDRDGGWGGGAWD